MKVLLAAVQRAAAADYATVSTMLALLLHHPTHVARSLVNGMRLRPDLSAKTNIRPPPLLWHFPVQKCRQTEEEQMVDRPRNGREGVEGGEGAGGGGGEGV